MRFRSTPRLLSCSALVAAALASSSVRAQPAAPAPPAAEQPPTAAPAPPEAAPSEPAPAPADPGAPPAAPAEPVEPAAPSAPAPTDPAAPSSEAPATAVPPAEAAPPVAAAAPTTPLAEPQPAPAAEEEPANPLIPPGEDERMSKRPVDQSTLVFKPGSGLVTRSDDGDFLMSLGLRAQFRYTLENDNAPGGEALHSFMVRRARITFGGHVFGEHNKFKAQLAVSPRDVSLRDGVVGTSPLLDWYMDFDHIRDLTLRVGQYKVPFNRQRVISSGRLQLVDRAITNNEFNLDRDIGIDLRSKDFLGLDMLRYAVGVWVGEGRNSYEDDDFGMMYIGRLEFLPLGMFKDYREADFARTGPRLSLGVAFAYIDNAKRDRGIRGSVPDDGGTTDTTHFTADAMFKVAGFSLLGEFHLRTGERDPGQTRDAMGMPILDADGNPIAVSPTRDGTGLLGQIGYLLPGTSLEVAARYAMIRGRDEAGNDGLTDQDEIGGGLSYYFARHPLKLQTDYMRLAEDGELGSGVDQFRLQLQASF